MLFGFRFTLGLMMAFYGFSVMKNLRVWAIRDAGQCGWGTQEKEKRDLISLKIEFQNH